MSFASTTSLSSRVVPLKCWSLRQLEFKGTDESPAYNASKHTFYLEFVFNNNGNTVSSSPTTGHNNSGDRCISLSGRLKSGAGGDVGHVPFTARGLRYAFQAEHLLPSPLYPSELTHAIQQAAVAAGGVAALPRVAIVIDLVNKSEDSQWDPVCKVKPLFGYGRIDFNFVLRQSGDYCIRLSLEIEPAYPSQLIDNQPLLERLNHVADELMRFVDCTAFFTYDTRAAKKMRSYASTVVNNNYQSYHDTFIAKCLYDTYMHKIG
jgi:hypothetical protein